jgi:DNA-directed RNA polymerase specialized sigma24 family protein
VREGRAPTLSRRLLNFRAWHVQYCSTEDSGAAVAYGRLVSRDDALELLPATYRDALVLRDSGHSVHDIAGALEIDPSAIESLLAIGDEKLASLLAST